MYLKGDMKQLPSLVTGFLAAALSVQASPVSIPFTLQGKAIYVQLVSPRREQPLRFLLDTGANETTFDRFTADALCRGIGGMGVCRIKTEGRFIPLGIPFWTDLSNLSINQGRKVDGLLGDDFLDGKVVTFDFANDVVQVEKAPKHAFYARSGRIHAPFVLPNGKALRFIVDTGVDHSYISLAAARDLGLMTSGAHELNINGIATKAYVLDRAVRGTVAGHPIADVGYALDMTPFRISADDNADGVLGMDFLLSHHIRLDFGVYTLTVLD